MRIYNKAIFYALKGIGEACRERYKWETSEIILHKLKPFKAKARQDNKGERAHNRIKLRGQEWNPWKVTESSALPIGIQKEILKKVKT